MNATISGNYITRLENLLNSTAGIEDSIYNEKGNWGSCKSVNFLFTEQFIKYFEFGQQTYKNKIGLYDFIKLYKKNV
jgi:hypothetical protein